MNIIVLEGKGYKNYYHLTYGVSQLKTKGMANIGIFEKRAGRLHVYAGVQLSLNSSLQSVDENIWAGERRGKFVLHMYTLLQMKAM